MQCGIKKVLFYVISVSFLLTLLNIEVFSGYDDKIGISNNTVTEEETLFERHNNPDQTHVNGIPIVRRQVFPEEKKEPCSSLKRTMKHNKLLSGDVHKKSLPPPVKINNIVIFLRFKGEEEFINSDKMQLFQDHYNGEGVSLKHYMKDVSYGQFQVVSDFFPTYGDGQFCSYEAKKGRNYYQPISNANPEGYRNHNSADKREHALLSEAVSYCKSMIESRYPNPDDLDFGENGKVDNVIFVIKGKEDTWDDLLWPHQFAISGIDVRIHNKKVKIYNLMLESCFQAGNIGTSVHEFLHTKGFPDFYRYKSKGRPVGRWDLMSIQYPVPQFPLGYPRYKYGAFCNKPSTITEGGQYLLLPSTSKDYSKDIVYAIKSPVKSRLRELFLVEYRTGVKTSHEDVIDKKTFDDSSKTYDIDDMKECSEKNSEDKEDEKNIYLWDQSLPDEGLLVYRVNKSVSRGNASSNGKDVPDNIFVFRKGISEPYLADGDIDNGATLKTGDELGVIADTTKPSEGNLENKIYFSDGSNSGIRIYDVNLNSNDVELGEKTATFKVEFDQTFITKVKLSGVKIMLDVPNKKILFKLPKKFDKLFIAPEIEHNGASVEPISGYPLIINDNMEYTVTSPTGISQKWQVITTPVGKVKCDPIKAKRTSQVSIKAEIKNKNGVVYQWYCDKKPIEGETDDQILIDNPADNKKHKYHVVASNAAGDLTCAKTEVEWENTTQEKKWPTFISGILSPRSFYENSAGSLSPRRKRFSANLGTNVQYCHKRNLSDGGDKKLNETFVMPNGITPPASSIVSPRRKRFSSIFEANEQYNQNSPNRNLSEGMESRSDDTLFSPRLVASPRRRGDNILSEGFNICTDMNDSDSSADEAELDTEEKTTESKSVNSMENNDVSACEENISPLDDSLQAEQLKIPFIKEVTLKDLLENIEPITQEPTVNDIKDGKEAVENQPINESEDDVNVIQKAIDNNQLSEELAFAEENQEEKEDDVNDFVLESTTESIQDCTQEELQTIEEEVVPEDKKY